MRWTMRLSWSSARGVLVAITTPGLTSDLDKPTQGESLTGVFEWACCMCVSSFPGENEALVSRDWGCCIWNVNWGSVESTRKGKGQLWWMVNPGTWVFNHFRSAEKTFPFASLHLFLSFMFLNCFSHLFSTLHFSKLTSLMGKVLQH